MWRLRKRKRLQLPLRHRADRRPHATLGLLVFVVAAVLAVRAGIATVKGEKQDPQSAPQGVRLLYEAPSLIDWTTEDIRARPELRDLQLAETQDDLPEMLGEVGARVRRFFDDFPNTACTEQIRSGPCSMSRGNCVVTFEAQYQYLLLGRPANGQRVMTEYRADKRGRPVETIRTAKGGIEYAPMLTYGFAAAPLLHFHPQNGAASRFRYFGRQVVGGIQTEVIGFAEIPGEYCCPAKFHMGNRDVSVFVQGLAWVDATTHQILRIRTSLLMPRSDVGLEEQTTQVEFRAIQLPEITTAFWLPGRVTVDIWFRQGVRRAHFRNTHSYSKFKLFRVTSRIRSGVDK